VAGLIIVLAVVLIIVAAQSGGGGGGGDYVKLLTDAHTQLPADLENGYKLGKDDAPIKLTEYEDFQCPICLKYTATQEPTLIEEYVKTGKMQITYQHLPVLRTESVRAALATQCAADQNKFWDLHSKLFTVQAEAGQQTSEKTNVGRFSDAKLREFAQGVGLDMAKYDTCFASQDALQKVQDQERAANALGFSGTPSFAINGSPFTSGIPDSMDQWRTTLDDAYKQLTGAASPAASATGSPAPTPTATKAP
jgi:protein-disulfide isomerase